MLQEMSAEHLTLWDDETYDMSSFKKLILISFLKGLLLLWDHA
jgi:hypothetical protein